MNEWYQDRVWTLDHPLRRWSVPIGTRMTVVRLKDNQLFIHSPIELNTQLQLALADLGQVAMIVTPNHRHHLFLSEWWLSYREAYFFAPPRLQQKRTDLVFDDALGAKTPSLWQGQLYQTLVRGSDDMEEVVFCDPVSKTLILGDTLAWLHVSHPLTALTGLVNGCYHHPAMPFFWRQTFKDKTRLRQSIQEILTWPFERIIFSHGKMVTENGKQVFAAAFKWLL
ncbi:DUF4336 domain-containing protein [Thaumasiovibrio subtropicus]|uniref:DUF4336 domain-containing protein n=1 Tax=Thaumasiovibrio subtropicus TaxID=1891207 RepID=UPI000B35D0B8|nr:DUF4336 domain-containing protein [Thaumasiovibrio subtropicus]